MADERIDVEINDKIDASIPVKLREISAQADKGATSVARLKAELASINATPAARLKAATDNVTSSVNRELNAQRGATAARAESVSSLNKEAAAQARISAMIDRTIARREAEAAAIRRNAIASNVGRSVPIETSNAGGVILASQLATAARGAEGAVAEMEAASVPRFQRLKTAATGAFDSIRDAITRNGTRFRGFFGAGGAAAIEAEGTAVASLGRHAKGNSTAIRELFVIAREGGRGDFTRMAGSVSILAGALGLMETVMVPLALVLAPVAAGLALFTHSFNQEAEPRLRAYANTLGLTSREMRRLGNETVSATGKVHEFNNIRITWGDSFHGFIATVQEGLGGLQENFNALGVNWSGIWDGFLSIARNAFVGFFGLVRGLVAWIQGIVVNVVKIVANVVVGIINVVSMGVTAAANIGVDGLNLLIRGANRVSSFLHLGEPIGEIERFNSGIHSVNQGMQALTHVDIRGTVVAAMQEANNTMDGFGRSMRRNTEAAARQRLRDMANAIQGNRNPRAARHQADPKTQSDYINDTNTALDNELDRMHMLKDAREQQQRLDTIEQEFLRRRMPLDEAQIEGFRRKIQAIQSYAHVQEQADRIFEDSVAPLRDYNAAFAAANELRARGAITQQDFTLAVGEASRKLAEHNDLIGANGPQRTFDELLERATVALARGGINQTQFNEAIAKGRFELQNSLDPLAQYNRAIDQAQQTVGLYGRDLEQANYLQGIENTLQAQGKSLYDATTGALTAQGRALADRNAQLLQAQYVQTTINGLFSDIQANELFVRNREAMYAEVARMEQNDIIRHETAERLKAAITARYNEIRLQGASGFFSELAQLSSSGNSRIAAIGKAAAVAQATIDGYLAVQRALAAAPPPWNFAMAAAVAIRTGAQVAGILSTNVGSFKDGTDFVVNGRTGVDTNNINMNVSNGERVIVQTPQQQRDAGKAAGGGSNVTVPVKVVNVHDPAEIPAAMEGAEGERVILNVLRRNPNAVAAIVNGGGGFGG